MFLIYFTDTFRGKVRKALMENVKAGETITYLQLANLVQNKGTRFYDVALIILFGRRSFLNHDGHPFQN